MTRSCRITPWQSSFSQSDSVSVESEARLVRAFSQNDEYMGHVYMTIERKDVIVKNPLNSIIYYG